MYLNQYKKEGDLCIFGYRLEKGEVAIGLGGSTSPL